jgi:hypothetical protein
MMIEGEEQRKGYRAVVEWTSTGQYNGKIRSWPARRPSFDLLFPVQPLPFL